MPEYTTRLNLPKPLGNENVTRANHNALVDAIDANAAKKSDLDAANNQISSLSQNKQDKLTYTPVNKAGDTFTGVINQNPSGDLVQTIQVPDDGWKTIRFQSPTKEHVSWSRDADKGKLIEVWREGNNGFAPKSFFAVYNDGNAYIDSQKIWHDGNATKTLPNGADLNSITQTGFYTVSSPPNVPDNNNGLIGWESWYVEVYGYQSAPQNWRMQRITNFNTGKSYQRLLVNGVWSGWKGVGGVNYKTYTSSTATTSIAASTNFDLNLVNVAGKGFVDILTCEFSGVNLSLNDGIELIVDGQILWSNYSSSGTTDGSLIIPAEPLVGGGEFGYEHNRGKFDRVYFNSSFKVRVFGTTNSQYGGSYAVHRFSYHLEQ